MCVARGLFNELCARLGIRFPPHARELHNNRAALDELRALAAEEGADSSAAHVLVLTAA